MSGAATNRTGFLELLKESEALARGANLAEKIHHAVYKAVKGSSTIESIRNGQVFTLDTPIPELQANTTTRKDIMDVLQRLISDQLIAQVFILAYNSDAGEIRLRPCYIAHTGDDRITPVQLFNETIYTSVGAIEAMIEERPVLTGSMIRKDLETDFKSQNMPDPQSLKATVIDPLKVLHPAGFDLVPPAELLREGRTLLREELVKRGIVADIINYGLLPLRDNETLVLFETAYDFMVSKILPTHKSKGNLKAEIDSIAQEEGAHSIETNSPKSTNFAVQKASAVKKTLLSQPGRAGGSRYPGSLAIEIILQLASESEHLYESQWEADINQVYQDFREPMVAPDALWFDMIRFVDQEEQMDIPPKAWNKIISDPDLLYSTWQTQHGTVHVIARKDVHAIKDLLTGMLELGPGEQWKILALRFLIEKYESSLQELFESSETIALYGSLLRRVYMQYIPWYLRIFMFFKAVQDYAFKNAKEIILQKQHHLEEQNAHQTQAIEKKRLQEKKQRLAAAKDLQMINRIVEKIDHTFQEGRSVPVAGVIRQEFPEIQGPDFYEFLNKHNFQMLSGPDSQGPQDAILLYPVDHNWRVRVARLRRRIEELLSSDSTPAGQVNLLRMIDKHLHSPISQGDRSGARTDPEDAYEKFEKVLNEQKQKAPEEEPTLDV